MFQLSKKVEYALIALRHMASGRLKQLYTTKEISERYNLSYELLAKVMQKLSKAGYIISHQGVNGGYVLSRDPRELKVSGIINTIEGKATITIVRCESENPEECDLHSTCTIKSPMIRLQTNINKVLDDLTVMEMF